MPHSRAELASPMAARYVGQIYSHFKHKLNVDYDRPNEGTARSTITFDGGTCVLDAAGGRLVMTADTVDGEKLDWIEKVVAVHLERFAHRDEAKVEWVRG